jgi:hypothetical protein
VHLRGLACKALVKHFPVSMLADPRDFVPTSLKAIAKCVFLGIDYCNGLTKRRKAREILARGGA